MHQAPAERGECKRLSVVLIKPSKYDDEGYVIRHFGGVLPSNTLACLSSLTEDLKHRRVLGRDLQIRIRIFDDTVQSIPVDRIIRSNKLPPMIHRAYLKHFMTTNFGTIDCGRGCPYNAAFAP